MMFVAIKFGNNSTQLFNPDCPLINFIDDVKKRCNATTYTYIDLAQESGEWKTQIDTEYKNKSISDEFP